MAGAGLLLQTFGLRLEYQLNTFRFRLLQLQDGGRLTFSLQDSSRLPRFGYGVGRMGVIAAAVVDRGNQTPRSATSATTPIPGHCGRGFQP